MNATRGRVDPASQPLTATRGADPSRGQFITRPRFHVCLLGAGEWLHRLCEFVMAARQMHHLDAIGVQALVVDQPFRQHQRLGRAVRLDVDLALEALETMAVRIQEILVEGDAVIVHLALRSLLSPFATQASMSASRWRLRSTI